MITAVVNSHEREIHPNEPSKNLRHKRAVSYIPAGEGKSQRSSGFLSELDFPAHKGIYDQPSDERSEKIYLLAEQWIQEFEKKFLDSDDMTRSGRLALSLILRIVVRTSLKIILPRFLPF